MCKRLNAPLGQYGSDTLVISTRANKSSSSGDATYSMLEDQLSGFVSQRDTLAGKMRSMLAAAFDDEAI